MTFSYLFVRKLVYLDPSTIMVVHKIVMRALRINICMQLTSAMILHDFD